MFFSFRTLSAAYIAAATAVALASPASAEDATAKRPYYPPNSVSCVAGCKETPPQVVATSTVLPTNPLPKPHRFDNNIVLRDVWCGDRGGCIAFNHIAPPRLRDHGDFYDTPHYIAVFHFNY